MNDVSGPIFTAGRKLVRCRLRVKTYHLAHRSGFLYFFFLFLSFLSFFPSSSFFFLFLLDKRFTKDRLTFWNQVWCEIIHLTGLWKFGLQCLFKLWCCGGKPSVFFLILGIFPMFWRVMIFYSKPHGRPCLLNLSTKANGVEPVLTVIKMSGLARVFWSIIR